MTATHHNGDPSPQIHNHPFLLLSLLLEDLGFFFFFGFEICWKISAIVVVICGGRCHH